MAALTTCAWAQWPTDPYVPTIVGSGWNVRAGDLRVNADSTVSFAVADTNFTGDPIVKALRMHQNGNREQLYENVSPYPDILAKKIQLLNSETSDVDIDILANYSATRLDDGGDKAATYRATVKAGVLSTDKWSNYNRFVAAFQQGSVLRVIGTDLIDNDMKVFATDTADSSYVDRVSENVKDYQINLNESDSLYYAFTAYRSGELTPSEIFVGKMGSLTANTLDTPVRAALQPEEYQSKPLWTNLQGANKTMLTWLGDYYGLKTLYSQVRDDTGVLVDTTVLMEDVVSYAVTPTTFNIPVVAAIERDEMVYPPADTLVAGLLGPIAGEALTLPFISGFQMDVKSIRQEANGDFSIVYSTLENGTNLLKVLRVSGTTASVLWNVTVADLGLGSAEDIDHFPNVHVDGDAAGNLYLLARYDLAYSKYSEWQAVRVRANGQLGSDPLVAPINLNAPDTAGYSVKLTWTDMSNSESIYLVARTDWDFSGLKIFDALPANSSVYNDNTAQPYTTYHYYVGVYNQFTDQLEVAGPYTITTGGPAI